MKRKKKVVKIYAKKKLPLITCDKLAIARKVSVKSKFKSVIKRI